MVGRLKGLAPQVLFYSHYGVGRDVAKLIEQAEDNTRACGDIILEAMKGGESQEEMARRLKARLVGSEDIELDPSLMVAGYAVYFKKKGMV